MFGHRQSVKSTDKEVQHAELYLEDISLGATLMASNWIQTSAGKGWWTAIRLYGPKNAVFAGTWKLADIVEMR